jgi:DNA-binding NarL/FixJ family response regulator
VTEVPRGLPWFYPLSPARAAAIELLAEGLSHHEIARTMNRKRSTIDMFVSASMGQLGLWTRVELAEWVAKHRPPRAGCG